MQPINAFQLPINKIVGGRRERALWGDIEVNSYKEINITGRDGRRIGKTLGDNEPRSDKTRGLVS